MLCMSCFRHATRVTDTVHSPMDADPGRVYLQRWARAAIEERNINCSGVFTARRLVCNACGEQMRTVEVPIPHKTRRWTRKVQEGEEEE